MTTLGVFTFESGVLQGTDGYAAPAPIGAGHSLESANPLAGLYSHTINVVASAGYGRAEYVNTGPTRYHAFYLRLNALPDTTHALYKAHNNNTARYQVFIHADGTLELYAVSTPTGIVSAPLSVGTVYRVEISNNDAVGLQLAVAEGEGAVAVVGATTKNGGSNNMADFGVPSAANHTANLTIDEIRIADDAMPTLAALNAPPFDGATFDDSLTGDGGFDSTTGGELDTTDPIHGAGSYSVNEPDSWGEWLLSGIFGTTTTAFYVRFNNAPDATTPIVTLRDDDEPVFSLYVDPELRVSMDGSAVVSQKLLVGVVYRIEVTYRNDDHPSGPLRRFAIAVGNGAATIVAASTLSQLLYGLLWRFGIIDDQPTTLDLTFDDLDVGEDVDDPPAIPELPDTVTPDVPASLAATEPTHSGIVVSWDSAADAVGYELRRSTDEADWTVIGNVTSPYTDSGLAPETTYYYQVRSIGSEETSDWSASQSATTGVAPDVPASRTSLSVGISI